jgi:hypothetical protein
MQANSTREIYAVIYSQRCFPNSDKLPYKTPSCFETGTTIHPGSALLQFEDPTWRLDIRYVAGSKRKTSEPKHMLFMMHIQPDACGRRVAKVCGWSDDHAEAVWVMDHDAWAHGPSALETGWVWKRSPGGLFEGGSMILVRGGPFCSTT